MEDIQVFDFKVSSSLDDYEVKFINNSFDIITSSLSAGDVIIIDNSIILHYPEIKKVINQYKIITLEANEKNKSYEGIVPIINELMNNNFKKNNKLVAIGGGITQDITAFIASILYRGVKWVFFPTTLLSQGDSCIGSKTSINFREFKNQVGGFYPPEKIFIDLNFLKTLPLKDLKSGLGEMCHYFIIAGEVEFKEYKRDYKKALNDKKTLSKMICNSLKIKKSLIEIDEFDRNQRQIFNYGHSFGHAIESLMNYTIPHGIAVSFGMDIANFISVKKGYLSISVRNEIRGLLVQIWDGFNIKSISIEKFIQALSRDKKNVGEELRLILCKGYGEVFKDPQIKDEAFKGWLKEYFETQLT
tara:strand:- start:23811 stop:24887 length:1077 start_codon:yes stop_codon:yes gene_type:complete